MKRTFRNCGRRAFSLIEVVIALGVVSFSVIPLIGLNSVSLATLKAAKESEIAGRIFRSVLNEGLVSDFSNLQTLAGSRSYDFEGMILGSGAATYQATVSVEPATIRDGASDVAIDGASRLKVQILGPGQQIIATRFALIGNRMKSAP